MERASEKLTRGAPSREGTTNLESENTRLKSKVRGEK